MPTAKPPTIHGLSITPVDLATRQGFVSITTDINAVTEPKILAGVCQHRNPERACLIITGPDTYQLGILREDVSNIED